MESKSPGNVIHQFSDGRLSRRRFLIKSIGIGFSLSAASALLAACAEEDDEDVDVGAVAEDDDDAVDEPEDDEIDPTDDDAVDEPDDEEVDLADVEETGLIRALEPEPTRGGTARLAIRAETASYDIQQGGQAHILVHLYNRLVRRNTMDGLQTIIPDLATNWEIGDDGLTYTFHIREGVEFHDGSPFSAEDVVATFTRITSPPEGVTITVRDNFRGIESIEQLDDNTVEMQLSELRPDLIFHFAATSAVIYSKAALEENDGDLRAVISPGTGAFIYEDHSDGEHWTFAANPDYWNSELPYVDGFQIIHADSFSDRGTAVLTDLADFSWNVSRETFEEGMNRPDEIDGNEVPGSGLYLVSFNLDVEPLDDPRVRRAIHLAMNRPVLREAFRSQETILPSRWVPPISEFATPPDEVEGFLPYASDKEPALEEAMELLADAGYEDGFSIELLSASLASHAEVLAPAIQNQLGDINIDVEIRTNERALLIEDQQAGNFELILDTAGSPAPDFSALAHQFFVTGSAQNFGNYSNEEFDDLVEESDAEQDDDARAELIAQAEDLLDQDPPWAPIGYTAHLQLWRTRVKGMAFDRRIDASWDQADTVWLDDE